MVRDDPHRHIRLAALAVPVSGKFLYPADHPCEDIRVVVAGLALQHHAKPFEAHSGIHIPVRKRFKFSVGLAVELHEHEVPYLDYKGVAGVHQFPSRHCLPFLIAPQVDMYLAARSARSGIAHFPEIVMLVSEQYPVFRDMQLPSVFRFRVHFRPVGGVPLEYCYIQPVPVYAVDFRQQFPRPVYRLGLEIVPETPVAEHFEHCMMVGIVAHFFQVIVLPADPQTFLTVRHPVVFRGAVAEEPVLELVHPCVCEHECRVILDHHWSRWYYGVAFGREKVQKSFPYFL